jgi:hypothetical protein
MRAALSATMLEAQTQSKSRTRTQDDRDSGIFWQSLRAKPGGPGEGIGETAGAGDSRA